MATPFLGEIKIVSFNFPPKGWAFCDGQLLSIQQNTALFAVFGTTYGGDGVRTFGLPNVQGRCVAHQGSGYTMGQMAGEQSHTLNISEIPQHTHVPNGVTNAPSQGGPGGGLWCNNANANGFSTNAPTTVMNPQCIGPTGGSQPHDNMSPYLVLSFIVSLTGIFPTQN